MYGKVTDIEVQKKNTQRVNVYVDNEFAFPCSIELVYKYNLQKGKEIEKENLKAIAEEDSFLKGKTCALRCIEKSHKSEQQIIDKLIAAEFEESVVTRVINFMKEYDFVNDESYTESYIREKIRTSGKNKIKFDLIKKGISKNIIQDKLGAILENDEKEVALKLGEKKLIQLMKSEKDKNKLYKKLCDFLTRSGYGFDIVSSVVEQVMSGIISGTEEEVEGAEVDNSKIIELAEKRYNVLIKSEKDKGKIYKKLSDYLLRRGYKWDDIKSIVKSLVVYEEEV